MVPVQEAMRVLVVDDSSTVRHLVEATAEAMGYRASGAASGDAAIAFLERNADVGLVVLNWNMPGMDGMECLRRLKASNELAEIPVLMLSAESEVSSMVEALREGAAGYLAKPFTAESLAAKLLEALG